MTVNKLDFEFEIAQMADYSSEIEQIIFDQNSVLSYKLLSQFVNISANEAKRLNVTFFMFKIW